VRAGFRPHQPAPGSPRPPARHGGGAALAEGAGRRLGARAQRPGRVERAPPSAAQRQSRQLALADRLRASPRRAPAPAAHRSAIAARRPRAARTPAAHGVAALPSDVRESCYAAATRRSPTLSPRRAASPAGISSTALAPRLPAARQGRRSSAIFTTRSSRSRNTASIAKRMKAMCTDERSEEHTSELQSLAYLVCRLLL